MIRNGMFIVSWMILSICITLVVLPIILLVFLVKISGKVIKKHKIINMV